VPDKEFLFFLGIFVVVLLSLLPAVIKHFREQIKNNKDR
jgi:hypothetical protein